MSKSPRALQELMTAVDAGLVDINIDSAPWRRSSHRGRTRSAPAPAPVAVEERASSDTSFEFSAVVSYNSSASPASMVFSDGQLRAHQFPAVRSSASADSSHAASPPPVRRRASSTGSYGAKHQQAGVVPGSSNKKRVSFATDGADDKAAAAKGSKKSGGLLGCMGSACGPSAKDVVEPARSAANRKVLAV